MLKKVTWKEDQVLSVRLRNDLFTLAQMRKGSLMEFFDVTSHSGDWQNVDLGVVPPIFCIVVAENRLKPLFAAVIGADAAIPNGRPTPRVMLDAVIGNEGQHGANLIELTDDFSSLGGRVIKAGLSSASDRQTIYDHELTGMVGSADKLRARLIRYFDTGVNWDEAKGFLFKDLPVPSPSRISPKTNTP